MDLAGFGGTDLPGLFLSAARGVHHRVSAQDLLCLFGGGIYMQRLTGRILLVMVEPSTVPPHARFDTAWTQAVCSPAAQRE
jgi:hypothetical protein